ncbi:ABC transporter substrate-binding protein [Crocinitomix catalasitica]|nr:ABC transporter substrate-binding protein [Crocinitomix catalasitica]
MKFLILIFLTVFMFSCISHEKSETAEDDLSSQKYRVREEIEIKYAKGFEMEYSDGYTKIITHSFLDNEPFRDSAYIEHDRNACPNTVNIIPYSLNRIASQSTTHLAFIDVLNELETVVGLCGIKYISRDSVRKILQNNRAVELCLSENIQLESLLNSEPDLLLSYPFGRSEQLNYEKKGVQTLLIAEYLEETQLARLEWIKVFGMLYGKVKEVCDYFDEVERIYNSLKVEQADPNKQFIMNLPFGESWFMPSSLSVGVRLMEDAGLQYYFSNEEGTENKLHSKEEVWEAGVEASYWIIIAERPANFSLADLVAEEAVYEEFKSLKNEQVLFCNTAEVDYFAKGVVEPHILLKDLLFLTHQIGEHQLQYFFRLK